MAKGDELFVRVEVSFLRSHRCQSLSVEARWLYICLWGYALEQRREIIERPSDEFLRNLAGLSHKVVGKLLQSLHKVHFICLKKNTIQLIGIERKHPRFQWKHPPVQSPYDPRTIPVRRRKEKKRKEKKRTPPLPPPKIEVDRILEGYPRIVSENQTRRNISRCIRKGVKIEDLIKAKENYARHVIEDETPTTRIFYSYNFCSFGDGTGKGYWKDWVDKGPSEAEIALDEIRKEDEERERRRRGPS